MNLMKCNSNLYIFAFVLFGHLQCEGINALECKGYTLFDLFSQTRRPNVQANTGKEHFLTSAWR